MSFRVPLCRRDMRIGGVTRYIRAHRRQLYRVKLDESGGGVSGGCEFPGAIALGDDSFGAHGIPLRKVFSQSALEEALAD